MLAIARRQADQPQLVDITADGGLRDLNATFG